MAIIFALTKLFDDVSARLAATGTTAPLAFGWRQPTEQLVSLPRYTWVPGDDGAGFDMGEVGAPKYPGTLTERPLGTLYELVTIYCEGLDGTDPEDERKQYESARALFDALFAAVRYAARGTFLVRSTRWVADKTERRLGATIRVVLSVEAKLPDFPVATVTPPDGAAITPQSAANTSSPETDVASPDVVDVEE